MRVEVMLAEKARSLVRSAIAAQNDQTPSAVILSVESQDQSLPDETVRGAMWTLVNTGEAELTEDGRLRLAAG